MSSMRILQLPASPAGLGLPGCWTLARDRAITIDSRQPGFLHVAQGAVWATLDGPHAQGAANDWGDLVLRGGARIRLMPGQHVVLESYPDAANQDARFSWEPDPEQEVHRPSLLRWVQRLRAWGKGFGLGRYRRRLSPAACSSDRAACQARAREQAWRTLQHLRISQP